MGERPYVIDQMISAKSIAARVEELAADITEYFRGTDKLIVVGLLRGSFVFIADLVRELGLPVEVDFLEASSYGDAMHSSREVRILKDLRGEIAGRDVLVVEDIIDTGLTMTKLVPELQKHGIRSVRVAALLERVGLALLHLVDQGEHRLLDEIDQPLEHLRLAGEMPVQGRLAHLQPRRQGGGGDALARLLQHLRQSLQDLQAPLARLGAHPRGRLRLGGRRCSSRVIGIRDH